MKNLKADYLVEWTDVESDDAVKLVNVTRNEATSEAIAIFQTLDFKTASVNVINLRENTIQTITGGLAS